MKPLRLGSLLLGVGLVVVLLASPALAVGNTPQTDIPYDISPLLKNQTPPLQVHKGGTSGGSASLSLPLHDGREPDLILTLYDWDPAHAGPHDVPFWKEYSGLHSDVYVGWNDLTPPPTSSQQDHVITAEQIAYLGTEFDERIWASDVFHFGWYKPRAPQPGMDGNRAAIFVYNIRDEAYWSSYRFYIAGFFWGGLNDALQVNAIFIDSYNWKDRIGPDAKRPYLYEATIAHEFQHLIHNDVDGDEDSFLDEGMADMAEQFLYGTVTTGSHIGEYLVYHRDSLTDWDGELYDYGGAVLWMDYLFERNGGNILIGTPEGRVKAGHDPFEDSADKFKDPGDAFIWYLIHNQNNGLESIADLVGGMDGVKSLHRDWTLANLLDGKVTEPQWNYRNLVLGGSDSDYYTIQDGIDFYDSKVCGNMPPTRKNVRRRAVAEPWGAYYRAFLGVSPGITMTFSGNAEDGVSPHSAPKAWYSGIGNMLERPLEYQLHDVTAGDELSFWTWFDIEEGWDYGYVQASNDGGATWITLSQTTSTLPVGLTNINGSSAWAGPGGLTGNSGGWREARFALTGLSGDVTIRFWYKTDEAVNGQGWYVDDVGLNGSILDSADVANNWTTDGWLLTTGLQRNDWVADTYVPYAKAKKNSYEVKPIYLQLTLLSNAWMLSGSTYLDCQYLKNGYVYGIVSNRPDGIFDATGRLTVAKGK